MSRRLLIFAVPLAVLLVMVLPLHAADPKPPASVADLAWMAGHWQGQKDGNPLEEHWTAPDSGTMMGMFRWIKSGRVLVYEVLALEDSPKGPVLLLRHFKPGLIGLEEEEKNGPLRCPLAGGGPGEVVFACESEPTRLTYRRAGENGLNVLLERQKEGKTRTDEFVYTRATPVK